MQIKIENNIIISEPTKEIDEYCEKVLTLDNPDFIKKQRMGLWIGKTPKKIYLYTKNQGKIIVSIGCLDDIWKINPNKSDYTILFKKHEKIQFYEPKMKPYDYQEIAINEMIKFKRGILQASCGSGKSLCGIEIIRRIGIKSIIICHSYELLSQFKTYLKESLQLEEEKIGVIANGKINIGSHVTLALRQTMANIDLNMYKHEWGVILVDECHSVCMSTTSVTQYTKILNNLSAEYRISLSATPFRGDGLTQCMFALCGKVKYEIPKESVADKTTKASIIPVNTQFNITKECQKTDGTIDYTKLTGLLCLDTNRNNLILEYLRENKNNNCLVLSDRLEGLKYLKEELGYGVMIDGTMVSKKNKEKREQAIEYMRSGQEKVLFASYGLAKQGLDIPRLDRLFLIAPHRDKATIIQSVGRIERKFDNKDNPIVYDFVDNTKFHKNMFAERKRIYKKNGNKIIGG